MRKFVQAAGRQLQTSIGVYYSNFIKYQFDKYVLDLAGKTEPIVTSSNYTWLTSRIVNISQTRGQSLVPLLNYLYGIYANSTSTFGLNQLHQNPCQSITLRNINKFNMNELYIPEGFCECSANGLTKISYLRSIIWTNDIENSLIESLPYKTTENIMDFYSSSDYIIYELYLNLIIEEKMLELQVIFRQKSEALNNDFNKSLDQISNYGLVLFSLLNLVFYLLFQIKSNQLRNDSFYIVKLIPILSIKENPYVKSKLMRIIDST